MLIILGNYGGNNLTENNQNIPTDQNNYQQPQGIIPARVVSGNGVIGYTCNLHANGLTETPTGQGLVFLANGASTFYALPAGTVLFVQAVEISIMGTND